MNDKITIEVRAGLQLTEYRQSDCEALAAALNNERIFRNTLRIPFPYSIEDARGYLAITEKLFAKFKLVTHFAIRDKQGELIGGFAFDDLVVEHSAEIGYWLEESHWGRGLMTNVIAAACDYGEQHWGLVRITADVFDFNRPSARVLEKNGFRREGFQRKRYRKEGKFIDAIAYARVSN